MFPPEVRHFQPHSCAAGQRGMQELQLPCHSLPSLDFAGWEGDESSYKLEEELFFIIVLVVSVWSFGLGIFGCDFFFFFKPKVKPLLFWVLFPMKGEVFSVWLLRHEHIAKECIAENRSLASHTIEVTSITKSEVLKGLWQFSLAALCEGNASFASVWQRVETAV